jgi:lysophospholipase L1-like esterase
MRKYNIPSDFIQTKALQPIVYKQYDNGDALEVELFEDGTKITLTDEIVLAFFELEDRTVIQKTCSINDNGNAVAILDNNVLSLGGKLKVEFTIFKDGKETTTRTIIISVEESINRNDAIEAIPQWDIVQTVLDLKASDGADIAEKVNTLNTTIETKFNELTTAQQVNSEVILARGGEASLGARLDSVTSSLAEMVTEKANQSDLETTNQLLAEKANQEDVTNSLVLKRDKSVLIDSVDITPALQAQIAGTAPIANSIPANESVTLNTLGGTLKSQFNALYDSFIEKVVSKNLYNKSLAVDNYFLHDTTGAVTASTSFAYTGFIPVIALTTYTVSMQTYLFGRVTFWNNGVRISGSSTTDNKSIATFTAVANSTHCTINIKLPAGHNSSEFLTAIGTIQLEKGSAATTYVAYATDLELNDLTKETVNKHETLLYDQLTRPVPQKNRYNPSLAVDGKYYNTSDGVVGTKVDAAITGKVPVDPLTEYTLSIDNAGSTVFALKELHFWKTDGTYLGRNISPIVWNDKYVVFTTPSNCSFVGATFLWNVTHTTIEFDSIKATIQLEKGSIVTTFEAYNPTLMIKKEMYEGGGSSDATSKLSTKKWTIIGDSISNVNYRASKNYHHYIQANTGVTTQVLAVSGDGYRYREGEPTRSFLAQAGNIASDSDYITLMGSINDVDRLPFGTIYDVGDTTWCGRVNKTIQYILTNHWNKKIGIITPIPSFENYALVEKPSVDTDLCNLYKIANGLKEIAQLYSLPVLDLYSGSNLKPWIQGHNDMYFKQDGNGSDPVAIADGIHPNSLGQEVIANSIEEFLLSL